MSSLEFFEAPVRQRAGLAQTDHRPWPLPEDSWTIAQSWEELLFAHWRVDAEALRELVPSELSLDEHDGSAWLGVVPFRIKGFRLRGTLPVPFVSSFPELNVRTCVSFEKKPGIWFFSLDTSSLFAVEAARVAYRLPYFHATAALERRGGWVEYSSSRRSGERPFVFEASYGPDGGEAFEPQAGTLEHFLTERYCLYARDERGLHRAEIHHPPWRLRPAEAEIGLNTMPPDGIELGGEPPFWHLAERQDVVIWPLRQAGRKGGRAAASTYGQRKQAQEERCVSDGSSPACLRQPSPLQRRALRATAGTETRTTASSARTTSSPTTTAPAGTRGRSTRRERIFKIKRNADGSYRLTRYDRGRFLTNEGPSPGACETRRPHGHTVMAGKHGRFHGFLRGRITGGTFDPNAVCPADCGFTDVWIATFFGPDATFSCFVDSRACAFDYEYSAAYQHLRLHHWSDKGTGAGTFLHERFHGDIATN